MDKVLDLFAGSGALGFEALSRGAVQVDFIEHDRLAVAAITQNAEKLGVEAQVRVRCEKVAAWAKRRLPEAPYDLVFIDPPYADSAAQASALLIASEVLANEGLVVVEHERMDELPLEIGADRKLTKLTKLTKIDQRHYGQTAVTFYQRDPRDLRGDVDG